MFRSKIIIPALVLGAGFFFMSSSAEARPFFRHVYRAPICTPIVTAPIVTAPIVTPAPIVATPVVTAPCVTYPVRPYHYHAYRRFCR
jgi:hypothetical protein